MWSKEFVAEEDLNLWTITLLLELKLAEKKNFLLLSPQTKFLLREIEESMFERCTESSVVMVDDEIGWIITEEIIDVAIDCCFLSETQNPFLLTNSVYYFKNKFL